MSASSRKVVLDASAVFAWIFNEPGKVVIHRDIPVGVLPNPSAVEVLARASERGYAGSPKDLLEDLQRVGLELEESTQDDIVRASELIAEARRLGLGQGWDISLGDALCISVAERLDLPLIGGDKAWDFLALKVEHRLFRK